MGLRILFLMCVAPFGHSVEAAFDCATLHSDESISWERTAFEDTFACVARSSEGDVLFQVFFDQFPDQTVFETPRREAGVVGGVPVIWVLNGEEYFVRIARLPVPGEGRQRPFQLLVAVPELKGPRLKAVLEQLQVLRIPAQSELP